MGRGRESVSGGAPGLVDKASSGWEKTVVA